MTELERWELINSSETYADLKKNIIAIANEEGNIMGRKSGWNAEIMASRVDTIHDDRDFGGQGSFTRHFPNVLTRAYGIRQQFLYLQRYKA